MSPSLCRSVLAPCTHLRSTSAPFSTTTFRSFLLSGKQDKKKHQQFVRRWQKRLLGDSEPIGAHVDPYDPTSPVRIAPEEQGEEEEILVDERRAKRSSVNPHRPTPEVSRRKRVGGQAWQEQMAEVDMAKEFEKLTLRTYTPMDLRMADEIESLTGTPYTLRDENLYMAQDYHEATGRPYTELSWGRLQRITELPKLRARFQQAVAEIYTLKETGLNTDLSTFANRGVYNPPPFVEDIKFHRTKSGELALAFPYEGSAQNFVEKMQQVPKWENTTIDEQEVEELVDEAEGEELLVEQPTQPVMDPNTPASHRAAVVKQDSQKKPFDFMSNRPVPRIKPVDKPEVAETVPQMARKSSQSSVDIEGAATASQATITEIRHNILEFVSQRVENNISMLRQATLRSVIASASSTTSTLSPVVEVKWRDVPLTDINIKFSLAKRLLQLTGRHISDLHLTSVSTLGDLYGFLCAAAKPKPTTLYSAIYAEGQKARQQAKKESAVAPNTYKRKQDLGDLLTLRNIEIRKKKVSPTQKRVATGLDKVVRYALAERGLVGRDSAVGSVSK